MKIETNHATITEAAFALAMPMARGCYQRALLHGQEALSGATLRGKAKKYGAHYAASRKNLLRRLAKVVTVREEIAAHGKRVLVLE